MYIASCLTFEVPHVASVQCCWRKGLKACACITELILQAWSFDEWDHGILPTSQPWQPSQHCQRWQCLHVEWEVQHQPQTWLRHPESGQETPGLQTCGRGWRLPGRQHGLHQWWRGLQQLRRLPGQQTVPGSDQCSQWQPREISGHCSVTRTHYALVTRVRRWLETNLDIISDNLRTFCRWNRIPKMKTAETNSSKDL